MNELLLTDTDLRVLLRHRVDAWPSQRAFAFAHAVDPGHLCRVLQGQAQVGPQLAALLGYRIRQCYELVVD